MNNLISFFFSFFVTNVLFPFQFFALTIIVYLDLCVSHCIRVLSALLDSESCCLYTVFFFDISPKYLHSTHYCNV